jgi:hypothetical protein
MEKAFSPRNVLSLNSQILLIGWYRVTPVGCTVVLLRHATESTTDGRAFVSGYRLFLGCDVIHCRECFEEHAASIARAKE